MPEQLEPSEIRQLYIDNPDDVATCRRLAEMPHLPFKVLDGMASSQNIDILVLAAGHPELRGATLQKLSRHPNVQVRCAVAGNRCLGPVTFMAMCRDPSAEVRMCLAKNPKLPLQAQVTLSDDAIPFVRTELLNRRNLDEEIQHALCSDRDLTVHVKALLYPKLTHACMKYWAENGTKLSLMALAKRKSLPEDIETIIRERGDKQVRDLLIQKN